MLSVVSEDFRRRKQKRKKSQQGNQLRVKVKLTLQEIATGTEKKIKVTKYDTVIPAMAQEQPMLQACQPAQPAMDQDMLPGLQTLCSDRCRQPPYALHAAEKVKQ